MIPEIKQSLLVAVLPLVFTLFACAVFGGQREFDRRPQPPLEQFPATAYKAPPTPQERAAKSATEASNRVARVRCKAAMQSLALSIGAPTGTTYQATVERAEIFKAAANESGAGESSGAAKTAAGAAALAAAYATGYASGRKNKGAK